MPAAKANSADGIKVVLTSVAGQFSKLDTKNPSSWPLLPKALVYLAVSIAVIVACWFFVLGDLTGDLSNVQDQENVLKESYKAKVAKTAGFEIYKKQKTQVSQYVLALERQLPSKAEIGTLLSDINQSGVGRGLQFDLFRPESEIIKDYYAEQPISIKVIGSYDALGAFASDIAHLSRIVTLNNITITPLQRADGYLMMEATAKTFRYLDKDELAQNHKKRLSKKKDKENS